MADKTSVKETILLAGGGTGGPTAPLLAVAEKIKQRDGDVEILFIGTDQGPERKMVNQYNIEFVSIRAAKLRRYFSLKNIVDFFVLPLSIFKALKILKKRGVDVVISAGGYVSVPVIWAAKILGKKILIHQQDIHLTLSNKLTAPFADKITCTFNLHKKYFKKCEIVGNPVRESVLRGDRQRGLSKFGLSPNRKTILVFGGATGAIKVNQLIEETLSFLLDADLQVLHITGKHKDESGEFLEHISTGRYVRREFLEELEMADAYALSDIVVSRAGLSAISELSHLGKPVIIIPIPDSHQEKNARYLKDKEAAIVLNQEDLNAEKLFKEIKSLIDDKEEQKFLSKNISQLMLHGAAEKISEAVYKFL